VRVLRRLKTLIQGLTPADLSWVCARVIREFGDVFRQTWPHDHDQACTELGELLSILLDDNHATSFQQHQVWVSPTWRQFTERSLPLRALVPPSAGENTASKNTAPQVGVSPVDTALPPVEGCTPIGYKAPALTKGRGVEVDAFLAKVHAAGYLKVNKTHIQMVSKQKDHRALQRYQHRINECSSTVIQVFDGILKLSEDEFVARLNPLLQQQGKPPLKKSN
jgi:hypothetical protein